MDGRPGYGLALWSSEQWRTEAVSWLDERLAAAGMRRTGEVTQPHLRPWGTVLTALTDRGPVWLKAPGPGTVFEVELYQLLERLTPDWVLPPIATDTERGWLVLPDGGTRLGDRLEQGVDLVDSLVVILPQYGQLQRDFATHVDELLSFGIADMRAAVMPRRFDEAVAAVGAYVDRFGDESDRQRHQRGAAMRERFDGWCARLASAAVPASLDHNDLHPWNIFVAGSGPIGSARFFDWGDSVVSHPFASLLIVLQILNDEFSAGPDDPAIVRARDAYLEVFSDLAPHAELVEELELACWVGKVARALTWDRSLQAQGHDQAGEFAKAPLEYLESLCADSYFSMT